MAKQKIVPIGPDFNMNEMVAKMTQTYQQKGYTVVATAMGTGVSIDFRKDDEGIKKVLGMSTGVRANIVISSNDSLTVTYDDEDWTIKIVVLILGLVLLAGCIGIVALITSIMGCVNQSGLVTKLHNDFLMFAGGGVSFGTMPVSGQPLMAPQQPQQAYQQPGTAPEIKCSECGASMGAGVRFCANCGTKNS